MFRSYPDQIMAQPAIFVILCHKYNPNFKKIQVCHMQ